MNGPSPNFDRVARIYRWAEYLALGRQLKRVREYFLPQLQDCRCALALGDGDGRFLAKLLRQNSTLQATAVDTSREMLALLSKRCAIATTSAAMRLQIQHASALLVTPDPNTDVIITHFFLDCLTQAEVDALALRLAAIVAPGTLWLVSDFAVPNKPFVGPFAAAYIRFLYLAFRLLTGLRTTSLPDPQAALAAAGFERLNRHESVGGLLYAELWQRR